MAVKTVPVKKTFLIKYNVAGANGGERRIHAHTMTEAKNRFYQNVPGADIREIFKLVGKVTKTVTTRVVSV